MKQLPIKIFCFCISAILFFSCQKKELLDSESNATAADKNIYTIKWYGQDIKVAKKGNDYYWFDDVIFDQKTFDSLKTLKDKSSATEPRSAVNAMPLKFWNNGIVYYVISSAFDAYPSEKQKIIDAINHWETNTILQFVQRTNESDYVGFERVLNEDYAGASNGIGRMGGYQYIRLDAADPFDTKTVIHEIGHAIGLYHEQSRADRDNYLQLYPQNMEDQYQFQTYIQRNQLGNDIGAFDWNSVMLYGSYSGSKNGQPTMLKKPNLVPFYTWSNTGLSQGDIAGIAFVYGPPYIRYRSVFEGEVNESYPDGSAFKKSTYKVYADFYSDREGTIPFIPISAQLYKTAGGCSGYDEFGHFDSYNMGEITLTPNGTNSFLIGEEYEVWEYYDYALLRYQKCSDRIKWVSIP